MTSCGLQRAGLKHRLGELSIIHVAGTKGKVRTALAARSHCSQLSHSVMQGSTCAMVESMLRAAGYKTGLFTSPHLCDIRERFRLDGCA